MARKQGSGFKMKRSPVKNQLGEFFKGIFGKEGIEKRIEKQVETNPGGKTDFELRMEERAKMRKSGKSKFQRDTENRRTQVYEDRKKTTKKDDKKTIEKKKIDKDIKIDIKTNKFITNPKVPTDPWRYKDMGDGTYITKQGDDGKEITVAEGDKGWKEISSLFKKRSPYKRSRGYKMNK